MNARRRDKLDDSHLSWRTVIVLLAGAVSVCGPNGSLWSEPVEENQALPEMVVMAIPKKDAIYAGQDPEAYAEAVRLAKEIGTDRTATGPTWGEFELRPGVYDWAKAEQTFGGARNLGWRVIAKLSAINMRIREMPEDLATTPFDDPNLQKRYIDASLALLAKHRDGMGYFFIGNEVDTYFQFRPDELSGFLDFLKKAKAAIKEQYPDLPVGVITTASIGWPAPHVELIDRLQAESDVHAITHYDLQSDFMYHPDPRHVRSVLREMVDRYGSKPIVLTEISYGSSEKINGSEEKQRIYVEELFAGIRELAPHFELVTWFGMHDFSKETMKRVFAHFDPGLVENENFLEYITSLGLRRWDGTPKPAWFEWKRQMERWEQPQRVTSVAPTP